MGNASVPGGRDRDHWVCMCTFGLRLPRTTGYLTVICTNETSLHLNSPFSSQVQVSSITVARYLDTRLDIMTRYGRIFNTNIELAGWVISESSHSLGASSSGTSIYNNVSVCGVWIRRPLLRQAPFPIATQQHRSTPKTIFYSFCGRNQQSHHAPN